MGPSPALFQVHRSLTAVVRFVMSPQRRTEWTLNATSRELTRKDRAIVTQAAPLVAPASRLTVTHTSLLNLLFDAARWAPL